MNRRSLLKGLGALAGVLGLAKIAEPKQIDVEDWGYHVLGRSGPWPDTAILYELVNAMTFATIRRGDVVVLSTSKTEGPLEALVMLAKPESLQREGWMLFIALGDAAPGERFRGYWSRGSPGIRISESGRFRAYQGLRRLQFNSVADREHARRAWEETERLLWEVP